MGMQEGEKGRTAVSAELDRSDKRGWSKYVKRLTFALSAQCVHRNLLPILACWKYFIIS
jgi:hypothetical protein